MANILIVDDDPAFAAMLKEWVVSWGHTTTMAGSVETFVTAVNGQAPALIFMDMQFPGGGAPAAVERIKANAALSAIPIIFISSMPLAQIKRWFPDSPQRRHHTKPPDFNLLAKHLEELLPGSTKTAAAGQVHPTGMAPSSLSKLFEPELAKARSDKETSDSKLAAAGRLVDLLMADAIKAGASDIHIDPAPDTVYIRYRVDGILQDQLNYPKDLPLIARVRSQGGLAPVGASNPVPEEGSFDVSAGIRARLAVCPSAYGDKITLRLLNRNTGLLNLDSLGFLPDDLKSLRRMIHHSYGMFLVSGATGSGKTTTLCSILLDLEIGKINIMTLEDPIEYQLPRVTHTQICPKVGLTFTEGLRALLRQDPNVIMVGEIRDSQTAEIALQAAMTGHMIFSSVHATNSSGVVARLIGMGVEPYMISSFLLGALSQRLIRKVCTQCAQPAAPDAARIEKALASADSRQRQALQALFSSKGAKFVVGKGCPACGGSGYKGRVGIYELLQISPAIAELIHRKATAAEIHEAALQSGMRTFLMDATYKAWAGWTTLDEALRVAA